MVEKDNIVKDWFKNHVDFQMKNKIWKSHQLSPYKSFVGLEFESSESIVRIKVDFP